MPEAAASARDVERERRIARGTDARCLEHWLQWGRRTLLLLPYGALLTWLAWQLGAGGWAIAWFVAWFGLQIHVYRTAGRLQAQTGADPQVGIVHMTRTFWVAGVLHAVLLPLFFVGTSVETKLAVSLLLAWVGGAVLISTSGIGWAYIGVAVPPSLVVAAGWFWHGGVLGWGLAFMYAGSVVVSFVGVRQQRQSWEQQVRLLDDNEVLATSLALERDRAEAASEAKTRFFAAASHDLRQPLHALSINATTLELVAQRGDDRLLQELSQGIARALQQSRGLLDGLLDISRLDAGAVTPQLGARDIGALLRVVRDEFAALAAQRGLFLRADICEPAPWGMTDADQLMRILSNLVDNAIKFTAAGGITLSLAVEPPDQLLVAVSDTGPGIAPAYRERVFEEFFQLGNPSRDRTQGLGLGLAIVRRTAALIAVDVRLADVLPHGTSFELRLAQAAAPVAEAAPFEPAGKASEAQRGDPLSVLVIDDEPEVVAALCTYLRQLGWAALGAASGVEAAHLLANGRAVDALVVDYRLHEENGIEVIDRLRALRPGLAAIVVTGDTSPQRLSELLATGTTVLHKPVDAAELAQALVLALVQAVHPNRS